MRVWLVWLAEDEECPYVWSLHNRAEGADEMRSLLEKQGLRDVFITARRINE